LHNAYGTVDAAATNSYMFDKINLRIVVF